MCHDSVYDESTSSFLSMAEDFDIGPCSNNDPSWPFRNVISKLGIIDVAFWLSLAIGNLLFSRLADRIGGTRTILITTTFCSIFCLMIAFSPSYWIYFALSTLIGLFCTNCSIIATVTMVEIIGKE